MTLKQVFVFLAVASMLYTSVAAMANIPRKNRKSRSVIFPKESSETEEKGPLNCVTPRGRSGYCINITDCQLLWNHRRNYRLLRRLNCGYQGEVPKVCCPVCNSRAPQRVNMPPTTTTTNPYSSESPTPHSDRRPLIGILSHHGKPNNKIQTTGAPGGSFSQSPTTGSSEGNKTSNRRIEDDRRHTAVSRNYNNIVSLLPKVCGRNDVPLRRVVGGHESVIGAWPWLAALYLTQRGIKTAECGGALVTAKHVITAAHCAVSSRRGTELDPSQITIRLGDHDLESDEDGLTPVEVQVRNIIKHENFVLRTFQNDIAILELISPVQFNKYVSPLCLPFEVLQGDDLAGRNAFVAGWGTTSFDGPASSKLLEAQLRIWENSECEVAFRRDAPITRVNLCAGDGDKDACRGDSGGPLMLPHRDGRFYMVGIVSFGKKCAEPGVPGVYTRITAFLNWIAENIRSTI